MTKIRKPTSILIYLFCREDPFLNEVKGGDERRPGPGSGSGG